MKKSIPAKRKATGTRLGRPYHSPKEMKEMKELVLIDFRNGLALITRRAGDIVSQFGLPVRDG